MRLLAGSNIKIVRSAFDRKHPRKFFACLRIENHHLAGPAAHEKTMRRFIERHRCVILAHFEGGQFEHEPAGQG